MTRKLILTSIIAAISASVLIAIILLTSSVFTTNVTAQTALPSTACPPLGQVQHWDKIIFKIKKDRNVPPLSTFFVGSEFDIKVLDDPDTVVNLQALARTKLVSVFGITQAQANNLDIGIEQVEYQTVSCGQQGPAGPPGPSGAPLVLVNKTQTFFLGFGPGLTNATVSCDPGQKALSGGYVTSQDIEFFVKANRPTQDFKGWTVQIAPNSFQVNTVRVQVTCANLGP